MIRLAAIAVAILGYLALAQAYTPTVDDQVESLLVYPEAIHLSSPYASTQLVVTARLQSGQHVDCTRKAKFEAPGLLTIDGHGRARPLGNGQGVLAVLYGDKRAEIPVICEQIDQAPTISFMRDVMPLLAKGGCNSGTCHGAQSGKNGFKLSLRGYDPLFDHRALTDDLEARRFNRVAPDQSLMLLKPSGGVPHVGGVIWNKDDPAYRLIRDWIAQGTRVDPATTRVKSIQIYPQDPVIHRQGESQQLSVIASYSDGSRRDVTAEAFLESSNSEVATVDAHGLMTTLRPGETTILARYEGAYAASTAIIMHNRDGFVWNPLPVRNFIDELVDQKLRRIQVQLSDLCTDAEFIRRVHLDLTGLPPTAEDVRRFLANPVDTFQKREALIDQLIGSDAFVEHWTNKWSDLLQVNPKYLGEKGAEALRSWLRDAVAGNLPYDEFVFTILTASGSNLRNPPASFFKIHRTPEDAVETTTQLFLAIRFNCNKCHDHPFERWTQDHYYQLASFFAQIHRMEDPLYAGQKVGGSAVDAAMPLVEIVGDVRRGEVVHQRTGQVEQPRYPFEHSDLPIEALPRRMRLAHWIVSDKNPYFARSYVNRVWSYLTGVGLIEPVDDIRAGNPPSNPALLDRLTEEFIRHGFDSRWLMRTICQSRTYQLSTTTNSWNEMDDRNYSHARLRRLPAEVLYDAVHHALSVPSRLPGLPPGARAAQLTDPAVQLPGNFLELLGKPARESVCECERSDNMMLGPVLAFINGAVVGEAIKNPNNLITRLALSQSDDRKLAEELFLAILNRYPSEQELEAGLVAIRGAGKDFEAMQAEYRQRVEALQAYEASLPDRQADWEARIMSFRPTAWQPLIPESAALVANESSRTQFQIRVGGSVLVQGQAANQEVYRIRAVVRSASPVTAIRLDALKDQTLPAKGPGRANNGNFVLNEIRLAVRPLNQPNAPLMPVELHQPQATFQQEGFPVSAAVDGNSQTGWAIAPKMGQSHAALFMVKADQLSNEALWQIELEQNYGSSHALGKFRLLFTVDQKPFLQLPVSRDLHALISVPPEQRTPEQAAEIHREYLRQDMQYARLRAAVAEVPPTSPRVLGAQDLAWALLNTPAFLFNR